MQNSTVKWPVIIGLVLLTAACAGAKKQPTSLLDVSTGPDASRVVLGKPLQTPPSYASLPAPDPSAGSIAGGYLIPVSGDANNGQTSQGGGFFGWLFGGLFN